MVRVSGDIDHSLDRMTRHACHLLGDARLIRAHAAEFRRAGREEYLLRLMALEILLKAGSLRESGELNNFGHDFPGLFEAPSERTKERARHEFGARGIGRADSDIGAPLEVQLQRLRANYTTARYVYEPSIRLTREEQRTREQAFVEGTLPVGEWDLVYHYELVELLIEVLLQNLSAWVPPWHLPT